MIVRMWRGAVRPSDADLYMAYVENTGLREYRQTPGNLGAWVMRRLERDRVEVVALSFWDSLQSIQGFAGEDVERAVFYPEDDAFLMEREETVTHYEAFGSAPAEPVGPEYPS